MKSIREVTDLSDKIVLLRVDFNVPVGDDGVVDESEDFRIRRSLGTIEYLENIGAKIIIISHIDEESGSTTLLPVYNYLLARLKLAFARNIEDAKTFIENTQIVLLENVRQYEGEKSNDPEFASELARLGHIYVNEAFSVSHREHASIVGLPKLMPSYAGLNMMDEVKNLSYVLGKPEQPYVALVGGAKLESKRPVIDKLMTVADEVLVGGRIGLDWADELPENVCLPKDYTDDELDIGPQTIESYKELIKLSKTVLWAGPMGQFEQEGYEKGTRAVAEAIISSGAYSVVGGGDTAKALAKFGLIDKFTFVSTGGGAVLEYIASGTLPGIEALG
jgi:phosphoglycerate kinase